MKRLSSYLFRVAGLSVLAGVAVIFLSMVAGDQIIWGMFERGLSPELRAEWNTGEPPSAALLSALNAFYTSVPWRISTPVAIFLGTLAGGLVGRVHSRRVMRPLDAVALAADRLAQGDSTARASLRPSRIAEVDNFVNNFNKMAESVAHSERELRESNAAIAHELRTPLTVLIGRLNGMIDGIFPMDEASLRILLAQTGQLHCIIDDLNLLTLAEAGRFRLQRQPVDLAALVAEALEAETAEVTTNLRPAFTDADPARVRQMLAALLSNARRYGHRDGQPPSLYVETGAEQGHAVLRVMDRGPGLPPDQAERAFDRFWRAEPSRGKTSGGSGLGLAVLRTLAEAHGGYARYDPRPGGGAMFTVLLPRAQGPVQPAKPLKRA